MFDEILKWSNSQEAIQAFGAEYARSNDFFKAWNVMVEMAQKNGSAAPLLFGLTYDTTLFLWQNPWFIQWATSFFQPKQAGKS